MVVDYYSIGQAIKIVVRNHKGTNTAVSSVKCGAITGVTTLGVAVLLGPVGIFAGALLGSTIAYISHKDKFKSLYDVYKEDLDEEDREELMELIQEVIIKFRIKDAITLLKLAQGNIQFSTELFTILRTFINMVLESQAQAQGRQRQRTNCRAN